MRPFLAIQNLEKAINQFLKKENFGSIDINFNFVPLMSY